MEGVRLYQRTTRDLDDSAVFDAFFEQMPQARKDKILRIKNREDRKRSLAAGILLCQGLAAFGMDGSKVRILTEKHGRPYLPDFPDIRFSLSHSGEMALAAFSQCEIGCDIEAVKKPNLKVARRFFCPKEQEWILRGAKEIREEDDLRKQKLSLQNEKKIGEKGVSQWQEGFLRREKETREEDDLPEKAGSTQMADIPPGDIQSGGVQMAGIPLDDIEPGGGQMPDIPPGDIQPGGTPAADTRAERFYRLWVLKESFLKATGRGLSLPMDEFCFSFEPEPQVCQKLDTARYFFEEYRYDGDHGNRCAGTAAGLQGGMTVIGAAGAGCAETYFAAVCLRRGVLRHP